MNGKLTGILFAIFLALFLIAYFALSIRDLTPYITLVLVLVTAYYAIQTGNMVKVMKEQTNKTIKAMQEQTEQMREQNRPNIRIHLQVKEKQLYMQISNVGSEYAQNLRCVPEPDFQVKHRKFSEVEIMELPMLFGGQMFEILLGNYQEVRENLNKVRIVEPVEELPKTERTPPKFAKLSEQVEERRKKDPIITCTYTEASGKSREIEIPLMLDNLAQARTHILF